MAGDYQDYRVLVTQTREHACTLRVDRAEVADWLNTDGIVRRFFTPDQVTEAHVLEWLLADSTPVAEVAGTIVADGEYGHSDRGDFDIDSVDLMED